MASLLLIPGHVLAAPQLPPNAEALAKALKKKIAEIKAADRYTMPGKRVRRKPVRRSLFHAKLGKSTIDYSKLDKVRLPVNPVKFTCTHPNVAMPARSNPRYIPGRVKSKLRWAHDYIYDQRTGYNYSASGRCNKALYYIMSAYCMAPRNPKVLSMYNTIGKLCMRVYKREWVTAIANAKNKPVPLWAISPADLKEQVKRKLRWATMYLKQPSKWYGSMLDYLDILKVYPKNFDAVNGFAYMYANYFGVTKEEATRHRKNNMLGGKLALLPKSVLYQKAIDELLAKNHAIIGKDTPRLGLSYLDVNYLLTQVYLPELRKHRKELKPLKCAVQLRRSMRAYDAAAVAKAMAADRGPCRGYGSDVSGSDIMYHHGIRMKFIEILAQKTANPQATIAAAAIRIASQVGAPRDKVCWLWENPYPESIKPSAGPKAHCSAFGGKMHNVRPGFFNFVYKPFPIKKLTKLQIMDAREILKKAGPAGKPLDKRLKKAYRRARGHKCLAWEVTVAKTYLGRGRYGKMYRYSNGGPREVKCSRMRRNGGIAKVFKSWNNHFDTVYGGKMKGSWRIITNYWRKKLRMQRPALVYVKRRI